MTTQTTDGVVLQQMLTTSLYQPTLPGPGEQLLFLRWATDPPRASIPLEQTWAASGLPATSGYFLFLDALPTDAPGFEQAIRKLLPVPTTSAFAWAVSTTPASVQTLLKTKLNSLNQPCVDGDTQLALPPGLESVGFSDGAPVLTTNADGLINGFIVTHPALVNPQGPSPLGLALPMIGPCVGCVQFAGLTNLPGGPAGGDMARKNLVNVSIDPHNPADQKRSYTRFTGAAYNLTQHGNSYFITRAS